MIQRSSAGLVLVWAPSSNPKYLMTSGGISRSEKTKIKDLTGRRSAERLGDAGQVDDNSLDAVTFALDLGNKFLHLVAVEGVGDILF